MYEAELGQKINTDKSSVFFSLNASQETNEVVFDILGPMQNSRHSKYLGLPSIIGKSKNEVFADVKEKAFEVEGKNAIYGWKIDSYQSNRSSCARIYYELFSSSKRPI